MTINNKLDFASFAGSESFKEFAKQHPNVESAESEMQDIFSRLLSTIDSSDGITTDVNNLKHDTDLQEGLGVDSLDLVELMMNCEDEFNFSSDGEDDASDVKTMGDLVLFVYSKIKN